MTVTPGVISEMPEVGFLSDGRADPAYAEALGLVPASRGRRSLAFAFDAAIWIGILCVGVVGTMPLWPRLRPGLADVTWLMDHPYFGTGFMFFLVSEGLLIVFGLVQLILHGIRGVTFGKMVFGLRTVRVTTFAKPGFWRIVARALLMYLAAVIVPLLGAVPFLLSPIWDPERRGRGWHDRMLGVWMLDVRTGLDPTDAKALRLARKAVGADPVTEQASLPSLATRAGHAADVEFVPSARSSSGVIAAHAARESSVPLAPLEPWEPPVLGGADSAPPAPPEPAAPRRPAQTAGPSGPGSTASAVLRFDDGVLIRVHGAGLLGRNPEPRPGENVQHVIPVPDATLQISKTHASFGFDDSGFWISDRNSSNGTTVYPPSGDPIELAAGQREHLAPGASVLIGGRRFTVEAGSVTR